MGTAFRNAQTGSGGKLRNGVIDKSAEAIGKSLDIDDIAVNIDGLEATTLKGVLEEIVSHLDLPVE